MKCGLRGRCKECYKKSDYKIYETWEGLVRRQVNRTNRVWKGINPITYDELFNLLTDQNYKCNHCLHELSCNIATIENKNLWNASLDRIDTSIMGYGNGNAQWLCSSCNTGKNTSDDQEHKNKFFLRDEKIREQAKQLQEKNEIIRDLEVKVKILQNVS